MYPESERERGRSENFMIKLSAEAYISHRSYPWPCVGVDMPGRTYYWGQFYISLNPTVSAA